MTTPYISASIVPALNDLLQAEAVVSNPTRALNAPFTPSATNWVLCFYTIEISSAITVTGGANGRVNLLSDAAATPTTLRAAIRSGITGTVVVGVALTGTTQDEMAYLCPPNHKILLQTVNQTGTPTYAVIVSTEILL